MYVKTAAAVIAAAILAVLAGTALADESPPAVPTGSIPTQTGPTVTTADPAGLPLPAPPVPVPTVLPAPTDPVQTLLMKQLRAKLVASRKSAWHLQGLLGQPKSPGGNIWAIGSLGAGKKLLATWRNRLHRLHLASRTRIQQLRREVDYMMRVMGQGSARRLQSSGSLELQLEKARRAWRHTKGEFSNPPQKGSFLCIHGHEGSWTDQDSGHNGHYGGVQMGRHEWMTYGYPYTGKLWAYQATPLEQLWAAYRYWRVSAFRPWSQTAPLCGLPV